MFHSSFSVGNVGNKGLREGEQNKFSKNGYLHWGLNLGPLVIHSDAFLTHLTPQVLIEGYLTSLLLLYQLTFGIR